VPLTPGTRIGSYEITAQIGAGGMGEVYRATDTNLARQVAIKILPEAMAADAERLARFDREAKILAALNHPNIAAIYGLEKSAGLTALVMEMIEGPTLAERIVEGALPVQDALTIATQIAEALEAAHEQGIIHRDLKPANIKLRPDGTVKVLDFGLAKASESAVAATSSLSMSPTITTPAMTQAGIILGTAAYMSPEQARGLPADHRSDAFAFGVVLYEMLTGRAPFQGETVADVLASILARDPDFSALPPNLNPRIPDLLRRCLEKNPKRRWQAVGDLRVEIETAAAAPHWSAFVGTVGAPSVPAWRRARPLLITALVAALVAGALTGGGVWRYGLRQPAPTVTRFTVTLPSGHQFAAPAFAVVAISPDGTQLVYAANQQLYLRSLSLLTPRLIAGTEHSGPGFAGGPFFSPDGRFVAFWEGTAPSTFTLKKIDVNGGIAVTICQTPTSFGGSWGADDTIVFAQQKGIMRVSANGGQPELVVEAKRGETMLGPQVLPGGASILFTLARDIAAPTPASAERWDKAQVVVQSLTSGARKVLIDGGSDARYLASGHVVYAVGNVLYAVPFDLKGEQVTATPAPVIEGVRRGVFAEVVSGVAQFSVSSTGSLVYAPARAAAGSTQRDLVIINRKGESEPLKLPQRGYEFPRVSPDGKQLAFGTNDGGGANVWIYELAGTRSPRQLTFEGRNRFPIWTADSQHVAFQSDRDGDLAVFRQRADGATAAERLTKPEPGAAHIPRAWSPDGRTLLVAGTQDFNFAKSLFAFAVPDRKVTPLVESPSTVDTADATFSPDGRWIAYSSDAEVFAQPFPGTGAKYLIAAGAVHPIWSRDGKELYFEDLGPRGPVNGPLNVVNVTPQPTFAFGKPVVVPSGRVSLGFTALERQYDVMPDGRGLVAAVDVGQSDSAAPVVTQLELVLNWTEELKRLAPTK
jgi:eukaryotic-like serine/threonine-protein kinase